MRVWSGIWTHCTACSLALSSILLWSACLGRRGHGHVVPWLAQGGLSLSSTACSPNTNIILPYTNIILPYNTNILKQHCLCLFWLMLMFTCQQASKLLQLLFFLKCVITDEVNILQELSLQFLNSSNTSMTLDDSKCQVLQMGQYSTLAVPLQQIFTDGYAFIFISVCNSDTNVCKEKTFDLWCFFLWVILN